MNTEVWTAWIPSVRGVIAEAYGENMPRRPWVCHDNERFLVKSEAAYKQNGLQLHRFPPNSGDLNPWRRFGRGWRQGRDHLESVAGSRSEDVANRALVKF